MAYSATVQVNPIGSGDFEVLITENDAEATSEATIPGLPIKGRVWSMAAQLVSGAGTTIDPVLGHLTNPAASGMTKLLENDTAAAGVHNVAIGPVPYYDADGVLFHRSGVDSGTDNVIQTRYLISSSWR